MLKTITEIICIGLEENNSEITLADDSQKISIVAEGGTTARIDLEGQTASVSSDTGEEKQFEISIGSVDEDENLKNITLAGESNTDLSLSVDEGGIQLTSTDENFKDFSVTVDGNEVELNNVDFTSTKNTVTVTVDEDNTITVHEDQDEDGENETILVQKEADNAEEETVIIKSANVEFQGKIQLQFEFSFPESVLADEGAYVTFEKAGTTTKKLISEGTVSGDTVSFIIPVPATEFADDIIVKVYDGEDNQLTLKSESGTDYTAEGFTYSVRSYARISDDFYGKTGTPAFFHIEVEGSEIVTYQWQYRMAGSTIWKTPGQASAKTADYSFKLKPSYDNIEVRCIVSDASGTEIISETRKANVFAYTSQPKDATAAEGQDVNFEVSAIGHNVKYQWYFKRPDSTWKKATKAGSTTAIFPITAGTINNGTSYRCVITDEAGNKITSAAGLLTVYKSLKVTSISDDYYGKNGTQASFHIEAEGNGAVTYQWQYRTAGTTSWRTPSQASAKTADYVFKLRPSYDNIEVRCIVSDDSGNSITSDVYLQSPVSRRMRSLSWVSRRHLPLKQSGRIWPTSGTL